jgi:hypothetical protein
MQYRSETFGPKLVTDHELGNSRAAGSEKAEMVVLIFERQALKGFLEPGAGNRAFFRHVGERLPARPAAVQFRGVVRPSSE